MDDILGEASYVLNEILRIRQLSIELLEQLDVTCHWILQNKIEVPNKDTLISLLRKTKLLLDEVYSPSIAKSRKLPFKKNDDRDPEELPKPFLTTFK